MALAFIVVGIFVIVHLVALVYLYLKSSWTKDECTKYVAQGFKLHNAPVSGYVDLLSSSANDPFDNLKKAVLNLDKTHVGIVAGQPFQTSALLVITDKKLTDEIKLVEKTFTVQALPDRVPWKTTFGFLHREDTSTELAREFFDLYFGDKAVSSQFSHLESTVSQLARSLSKSDSSCAKVGISGLIFAAFQRLAFGNYSKAVKAVQGRLPAISGLALANESALGSRGLLSSINIYGCGVPCRFRLVGGFNQAANLYQEINIVVENALEQITLDPEGGAAAEFNKKFGNGGQGLSPEDFCSLLMDTVVLRASPLAATLCNLVWRLALQSTEQQVIRTQILALNDKLLKLSIDDLFSLDSISNFLEKELDLQKSTKLSQQKLVFKSKKVGSVTFQAGDYIVIPDSLILPEYQGKSEEANSENNAKKSKDVNITMEGCLLRLAIVHLLLRYVLRPEVGEVKYASLPLYQVNKLPVKFIPLLSN